MNNNQNMNNNNQYMTGQELKILRLKHLKAKKEELSAKLASASLPEKKRAALTARQDKINERIAIIITKLEQKPEQNKLVQQALAPAAAEETPQEEGHSKQNEVAALKTRRAARARRAITKPGPLQRAACVESKLAHVRTVLANLALPPQRKARLEAKEKRLGVRLAVLLGPTVPTVPTTEEVAEEEVAEEEEFVVVADTADAKADDKGSVQKVRTTTDKAIRVNARLVHVKSVLGNPALPAERRLRLEAKEKILTARLQEISAGGGKGQGQGSKGAGKGVDKGKGAGKGKGGLVLGKGGKGHGKGKGAEEACGSGDE
jgi:hypothetical protein